MKAENRSTPTAQQPRVATVTGMQQQARRIARRWYAGLPKHRRVRGFIGFDRVRLLQTRNLLPGLRRFPIVVTRRTDGLRLRLSADPVDEEVADSVTRKHRDLYFPPAIRLPVRTVLDVGAHHGHFAAAAAFEFPEATIIALEPSAAAAANVRRHIDLNRLSSRVRVVQAALGNETGSGSLLHDATGSWGHSLIAVAESGEAEPVRITTLGDVCTTEAIDYVKCNAEGGEVALVAALGDLPCLPHTLVLMVHPHLIDADALREQVRQLGYGVVDALDGEHPAWVCTLE